MAPASEWEAPVRQLVIGWSEAAPEAGEVGTREARRLGWSLLCDAVRVVGHDVAVEADLLFLAAWLFWCRWRDLPEGPDRENLETAIRLFTLTAIADPADLGAAGNLPAELREVIDKDALEPDELLIDEARGLLDILTREFDAVAIGLVTTLTEAALALAAQGDPRRADYLSNLAAALFAAHRGSGDAEYLRRAVQACRTAVPEAAPGPPRLPHLVNLAIGLNVMFDVTGDLSAVEESLGLLGALFPSDISDAFLRARALSAHSTARFAMYQANRDPADLALAIDLCRGAVAADGETGAPSTASMTNLAEMLRIRYELDGDQTDLDQVIRLLEGLLRDASDADLDRPRRMAALASALSVADPPDLDRSVELCEAAVLQAAAHERVPVGQLRPSFLANLSSILVSRHVRTGSRRDLRRGVAAARLALMSASPSHPGTAEMHGNLGNALVAWYERTGRLVLLDRGIEEIRRALRGLRLDRAQQATLLSNLGAALFIRASRLAAEDDIEEAMAVNRSALELTSPGCPDRSRRLANLAVSVEQAFELRGDPGQLDEAIETYRMACAVALDGGTPRSQHLSALAGALVVRHWLRMGSDDLQEAVALHRESVAALPAGHADRSRRLANLASALLSRHRLDGDPADAEEAVSLMRAAVRLVPQGDEDLPYRLNMLGVALTQLASSTDDRERCHEAVGFLAQAVEMTPAGDLTGEARLRHLGDALELRFRLTDKPADLDAAIAAFRSSAERVPVGFPDRALDDYDLGQALAARAEHLEQAGDCAGAARDRQAALTAWRSAAQSASAAVPVRLAAADRWARTALATGDLAGAVTAFALAIELMPRLSWRGLPRPDQERLLLEWNGLAGEACAAAIEAGLPRRAVELLDAGRSILWEQQLNLRRDASALAADRPDLASRLRELCMSIRALETGSLTVDRLSARPRAEEPGQAGTGSSARMSLSRRLDELTEEIRRLDGYSGFWRIPPFDDLAAAARAGPVILVNVSARRCDALIVRPGEVEVVSLPDLTLERADFALWRQLKIAGAMRGYARLSSRQRVRLSQELRDILDYLWRAVAAPVLARLGIATSDGDWPRLWWCPTGPLSLLPLHAAQTYDPVRGSDIGVIDHVISSYTPALRALRTAADGCPAQTRDGNMLVVAVGEAGDAAALTYVQHEVAQTLLATSRPVSVLTGREATRQAVSAGLHLHRWLHFAGHSLQDLRHPGRSRLRLADGDLTLVEIAALELRHAELAYLSSCEGGTGAQTLPDEAVHLAASLQMAGFRHVVAAVWSIPDQSAAAMAGGFYQRLEVSTGSAFDWTVAEAVHRAARQLRSRYPPLSWAAYLHIGP
jgi:tetratricopeptide (TPR) repeat protein